MNMITQKEFQLRARTRGCHLVTDEVVRGLGALPEVGVLHLLLKHTSAGLCLNENWDADVRHDMNEIFNHLVPENQPYFTRLRAATICQPTPRVRLWVPRSPFP